jgi:hypothetical protein
MHETKMSNGQIWYTVKFMEGFEECSFLESTEANNGNPIRFIKWDTGNYTFHRPNHCTSGRKVKQGPKTIWLRKAAQ